MTKKEKFFHDLLITIHTLRWTGNSKKLIQLLEAIGAYSYAHTNSNITDEEDKCERAYEQLVISYNKLYDIE